MTERRVREEHTVETSGISGSTSASDTSSAQSPVKDSTVGGADFLSLLVTQLAYQDPLAPMDNFQFTQQLVSLASLEQLTTIAGNSAPSGSGSGSGVGAVTLAEAAGFIGLDATVETNSLDVTNGMAGTVDVKLDAPASSVQIEVIEAGGGVVRAVTQGPTDTGKFTVNLDGTSTSHIANGEYTVKVTALGADGRPVAATVSTHGVITAVSDHDGQIYVDVNGQSVRLDELTRIAAPATPSTSG